MKKNDKLVVLFGVIILVIASLGVYLWVPEEVHAEAVEMKDIVDISSVFSREPGAITVSDSCPFYPLIVTPLAVHYDPDGMQYVKPLYIKNSDEVSRAVTRAENQIGVPVDEVIDDSVSPKNCSLYLAKKYWDSSDAAIIIQYNETGYNLGVVATPLASYLGIPVIVTDEVDAEVVTVLSDLGVKYSIVCGDIEGYGEVLRFEDVDKIVDASIELVKDKFGDVNYITITNPRDAWPPEVLNKTYLEFEGTLIGGQTFPSHIIDSLFRAEQIIHTFEIPKDYKYCLVKVNLENLMPPENVEKFGDEILIQGSLVGLATTSASAVERDEYGNVKSDGFYFEEVLYDSGGEERNIKLASSFHTLDHADYKLNITFEKLSNPYYSMMKQFSSIAPYLTAYHQGIVFAKPDFAFVADDDKILDGKTLPGAYSVKFNWKLIPLINRHIYDNIHLPLNDLLGEIRNISDMKDLRRNCLKFPFYIALVGDTAMVPQYYYRFTHNDPFKSPDAIYGTGTPSDFIYGNIDPETYFMQPLVGPEDVENDICTYYPEAENIVGRITGWDVQDASALIARTIFYNYIIGKVGDGWKDNAAVMTGAGAEVQKLPIINTIQKLRGDTWPMKIPTGEKRFMVERISDNLEKGGFNVETAERGRAQRVGYSKEALSDIKKDGFLNRLFFPKWLVQLVQGFENIKSLRSLEWWKEALSDGSGIRGGEIQESSNIIISDSHAIWYNIEHGDSMMHLLGGPPILYQLLGRLNILSMRTPLEKIGAYNVRSVEGMDMGPSVMFIEGCGSGKIDSLPPKNTIANTYLHAGVNAYISPSTYSSFYGILEPRFAWSRIPFIDAGVGLGILGYIKAWIGSLRGNYIPVHFSQVVYEHAYQSLIESNTDIGRALRDAKNEFLPDQANVTYLWTPTLSEDGDDEVKTTAGGGERALLDKYATVYQLNLLGDPAFNPYEPCNEGRYQ